MKARSYLALALVGLAACGDSTPPPVAPAAAPPANAPAPSAAADAPNHTDGDVTVGWFRGMEIIVKKDPTAEFVSGQLYIRGGARDWGKDNAGIEDIALSVATGGGTRALDKDSFSRKIASLGASINGSPGNDFATLAAKSPKSSWDELFPVFIDTFLAPALPASEFEVVKQRALAARRHEREDGDGRLWLLARKEVFGGHPYENRSVGTEETITAIKLADVGPHLAKLRDTNRLVLVIVGDVDPAKVIERTRQLFASVPQGSYRETPMPQLHFGEAHLVGDSFKLPTNYIQSMFAAPSWHDPDFVPMRLAMSLLQQRVWDEVRTKRNLSYAPSAQYDYPLGAPFGQLYVTTVDPDAAMKVMFDEAHRLQTDLIPAKELEGAKSEFVTGYLMGHETTDGQASILGEAQLLGGDWHEALTFPEALKKTTPEQVRAAAKKWITNLQTAIVGDPGKLDPKIVGAK